LFKNELIELVEFKGCEFPASIVTEGPTSIKLVEIVKKTYRESAGCHFRHSQESVSNGETKAILMRENDSNFGTSRAYVGRVRSRFCFSTSSNPRPPILIACGLLLALALLSQHVSVAAASVSLAWDPGLDENLAGYNIYRSIQAGVFNSAPLNGTNLLRTETFSDSSVQVGQTYYYVVKAVNSSGAESAPSNQIQVTINNPVSDTSPPTVSITLIPLSP